MEKPAAALAAGVDLRMIAAMLSLDHPSPAAGETLPPGVEVAGRYATEREAAERGLVVLAMGLGYWIVSLPGGYALCVGAPEAAAVREQLALYERESAQWPPRPRSAEPMRIRVLAPLAWVGLVAVMFRLQLAWPGRFETWGALDGGAVFLRGEWWRPVTALFLHADLGHLAGNIAFGFFLFGLVLGAVGVLRGLVRLAAASVAGNIAAAALHPWHGYSAIGASTAVFAALGLLTGAAVREVLDDPGARSLRALAAPAFAGFTLLALHGAGGLRTDVIAHGTGFAAGFALGAIRGLWLRRGKR